MKTKFWAIALMAITTIFTSVAQVLYKTGADKLSFDILAIITNLPIIAGLMLYAMGAVLMIIALRGGELSVLYPIIATSYIWVGIMSFFFFNEALNVVRWLGIFAIFFGVFFIGLGSRGVPA